MIFPLSLFLLFLLPFLILYFAFSTRPQFQNLSLSASLIFYRTYIPTCTIAIYLSIYNFSIFTHTRAWHYISLSFFSKFTHISRAASFFSSSHKGKNNWAICQGNYTDWGHIFNYAQIYKQFHERPSHDSDRITGLWWSVYWEQMPSSLSLLFFILSWTGCIIDSLHFESEGVVTQAEENTNVSGRADFQRNSPSTFSSLSLFFFL